MASAPEEKAIVKAPVTTGGQLAAFVPQSLEEAWRLSTALASSGMTPKAYGNDPNKVMVGIMAGAELGLTPFAALQSIAVIGNNPAVWGDGLLALCEASGKMEDIEETDDGTTATCRVVRIGRKTPIVRTFSMDDAKKAGLAGKSGPWSQYPARMRQMRARAFALRDAFADVLRGMKSAEEVRDYAPMSGGTISNAPGRVTAAALIEQTAEDAHDPETGEVEGGRDDSDHGERHNGTDPDDGDTNPHPLDAEADAIIKRINAAEIVADVLGIMSAEADAVDFMPDDIGKRVRDAADARVLKLKGGK